MMFEIFEKEPVMFASSEGNVWKYVFHFQGAIAEAVLYKYNSFKERTVLCVSVQSGCPVGCGFCGSGSNFIRNLTHEEIVMQIDYILINQNINTENVNKFQIMFMSMGEPFLNFVNVSRAISLLNLMFPNAQLLVSTVAPQNLSVYHAFTQLSCAIPQIGLQFSIHKSTDEKRNELIPYKNKLTLAELRDYGIHWWRETGRKPYLNYCVNVDNSSLDDYQNLRNLFPANVFCFTFSVICSHDETMTSAGYRNLDRIREFERLFMVSGYDTRVFDPAGQDDIGGGCGQLFYVQQYLKGNK